jgi:D-threo-aldose 1-dehydrogenase
VLIAAKEWGDWEAFLLADRYTLLEQAPVEDLLPKCVVRGVSIVVGGPFNSGILAGRDTWNYDTVAEFADNLKLLQLPNPPALRPDMRAEKLLHPDAPTPR